MNRINNDELTKALKDVYNEKYKYIPDKENYLTWNFSDDFIKKMDKLIARQKKVYWKYTNSFWKKSVLVILTVLFTFTSAMSVSAFREPVIDFIIKIYDEFSELGVDKDYILYFDENINSSIETVYLPNYIPTDYNLYESYNDHFSVNQIWVNENDDIIDYRQTVLSLSTYINTENTIINEKTEDNIKYYYYKQNNNNTVIWCANGYYYILSYPVNMPSDDVDKIFKNITKNDTVFTLPSD